MKSLIINGYLNHLKSKKIYSKEKLEKIEYSLTGIYLTFSKIIVILIISLILGIFKQTLIFILTFNILRTTGCGLHASKSITCLISSIIFFIGLPFLANIIHINILIKILICIICIILLVIYAPADTKKKPMINKKRRMKLKYLTLFFSILFSITSIVIKNNFISNCLIISMLLEVILVLPLTYKLLNMPYRNYITYLKKHPELKMI